MVHYGLQKALPQRGKFARWRITMDVPVDARVECTDGPCGRSTYAIVDPAKEHVTHVVIEESGLSGRERLVPVSLISESTPDVIRPVSYTHLTLPTIYS